MRSRLVESHQADDLAADAHAMRPAALAGLQKLGFNHLAAVLDADQADALAVVKRRRPSRGLASRSASRLARWARARLFIVSNRMRVAYSTLGRSRHMPKVKPRVVPHCV